MGKKNNELLYKIIIPERYEKDRVIELRNVVNRILYEEERIISKLYAKYINILLIL